MKADLAIVITIVFFFTIEVVVKLIGSGLDAVLVAESRFRCPSHNITTAF
ncbi:MAG: hypothetical protein ACOCW2_00555 [Chitinivibrionales bacterium]